MVRTDNMDIYTVSLFGNRHIENASEIEKRLEIILKDIIMNKEYVEFLIGREGDFDILASSVIKRIISKNDYGNTHFVLVLPYMKAEYRDNKEYYLDYYDEVEICSKSETAHPKSAIQIRNRNIVDRSDLVICCIQYDSGGAYRTMQYAIRQKKNVINIAE